MKLKIILVIILIFGSANSSFSKVEKHNYSEPNFDSFWDFYSNNYLSTRANGKGYTGIASRNGISGVILNPASLEIGDKYQVHFEYVYKSKIQPLKEWTDTCFEELHPAFLSGAGVRLNDHFQIGLLYFINSSYKLDYGEMEIEDFEGNIISVFYPHNDFKISSLSIPIVFIYKNKVKFGVSLTCLNYTLKEVLLSEEYSIGKVNFYKIIPRFGIVASPFKNLSLGLTYLPETKQTITKKWNSLEQNFQPNIFPLRVGIGLEYKLDATPISLSVDYNYSNNSRDERLVDRHNFHYGIQYDINNTIQFRTGLFTERDYRNKDVLFIKVDYNQIFVTLGACWKIRSLTLNFSAMDSHLFSVGEITQTYVNTGVSYNF